MTVQQEDFIPIDWTAVYRVSTRKRHASAHHIELLSELCGKLPAGYIDFIDRFGIGYLDDIQFLDHNEVVSVVRAFRDSLREWVAICLESGTPEPIPADVCNNAVILARTGWGASYFCTPTEPGTLWYVPRSQDWEDFPDEIPMGFLNPFVHKQPGCAVSHYGKGDLVFTPANVRSQIRWTSEPTKTPVDLESNSKFVEHYVRFDKQCITRYRVTYYCQALSLSVNCSSVAHTMQVVLEFDDDDRQEVERIAEEMFRGKAGKAER